MMQNEKELFPLFSQETPMLQWIAGPCSIESKEQLITTAQEVKAAGATGLRGGAFKPRTSHKTYQGIGLAGLDLLNLAKEATGLPVVTEIMDHTLIPHYAEMDILQVGARNMQNFTLLKALGQISQPILLKRGFANTIEELLSSAEYLMMYGKTNIILCERGIRTFEPSTRNSLDISSIPILKARTSLPIIVDPSHASGQSQLVSPLTMASIGAGADGIMIEAHCNPSAALCDKEQAITPKALGEIIQKGNKLYTLLQEK